MLHAVYWQPQHAGELCPRYRKFDVGVHEVPQGGGAANWKYQRKYVLVDRNLTINAMLLISWNFVNIVTFIFSGDQVWCFNLYTLILRWPVDSPRNVDFDDFINVILNKLFKNRRLSSNLRRL